MDGRAYPRPPGLRGYPAIDTDPHWLIAMHPLGSERDHRWLPADHAGVGPIPRGSPILW